MLKSTFTKPAFFYAYSCGAARTIVEKLDRKVDDQGRVLFGDERIGHGVSYAFQRMAALPAPVTRLTSNDPRKAAFLWTQLRGVREAALAKVSTDREARLALRGFALGVPKVGVEVGWRNEHFEYPETRAFFMRPHCATQMIEGGFFDSLDSGGKIVLGYRSIATDCFMLENIFTIYAYSVGVLLNSPAYDLEDLADLEWRNKIQFDNYPLWVELMNSSLLALIETGLTGFFNGVTNYEICCDGNAKKTDYNVWDGDLDKLTKMWSEMFVFIYNGLSRFSESFQILPSGAEAAGIYFSDIESVESLLRILRELKTELRSMRGLLSRFDPYDNNVDTDYKTFFQEQMIDRLLGEVVDPLIGKLDEFKQQQSSGNNDFF